MANKQPQKDKQVSAPQAKPVSQPKQQVTGVPFIFDKTNYMIMIAGVVVIMIGYLLMSGGTTTDMKVFPREELYSFRRITLAPIVIMIGFAIEAVAILKRPKV